MIWHLSVAEAATWPQARIERALDFLANTDFATYKHGDVIDIDEKNLYAMVQAYETAPHSTLRWETHDAYADIQYVVEGREGFGTAPRDGLAIKTEYNAEKDITFYDAPVQYNTFILNPGDCILVTPDTAHMPKGQAEAIGPVKKVVIKVKMA